MGFSGKKSRVQKFRETACALDADQLEAAFNAALVAKAPLPPKESKPQTKKPDWGAQLFS
jgi:hypothetical protein